MGLSFRFFPVNVRSVCHGPGRETKPRGISVPSTPAPLGAVEKSCEAFCGSIYLRERVMSDSPDDATTVRRLVILLATLVLTTFGVAGLVSIVL